MPMGSEGGIVELVSNLNDGTILLLGATVVTTAGVRPGTSPQSINGWTNTSYDLNMWAWAYGKLTIKGGMITTELV